MPNAYTNQNSKQIHNKTENATFAPKLPERQSKCQEMLGSKAMLFKLPCSKFEMTSGWRKKAVPRAAAGYVRQPKTICGCSFGCKSLLNFICLTMKFHHGHFTNVYFTTLFVRLRTCLDFGRSRFRKHASWAMGTFFPSP